MILIVYTDENRDLHMISDQSKIFTPMNYMIVDFNREIAIKL